MPPNKAATIDAAAIGEILYRALFSGVQAKLKRPMKFFIGRFLWPLNSGNESEIVIHLRHLLRNLFKIIILHVHNALAFLQHFNMA